MPVLVEFSVSLICRISVHDSPPTTNSSRTGCWLGRGFVELTNKLESKQQNQSVGL